MNEYILLKKKLLRVFDWNTHTNEVNKKKAFKNTKDMS